MKPFLSVTELGARLGVSGRTAYNLVNEGAVPHVKIRGVKRIPVGALERWLADQDEAALSAVRREAAPPRGPCEPACLVDGRR